jgi:hypothetical protein
MVIVMIHFVVFKALGCSHSVLRDRCQDNVHQLNVIGAHQEAQQSAVHLGLVLASIFVDFPEELVQGPVDNRLEYWFSHSYDTHENASSDAAHIVDMKPKV